MECPKCQFENREGAKFCGECGHKFEIICPACGTKNQAENKFCDECGSKLNLPLQQVPKDLSFDEKITKIQKYLPKGLTEKILSQRDRIEGERKQVAVMFCDMEDFTPLSEILGIEKAYSIMDQVYEILIHKVHDYEGTVNEMTGDGGLKIVSVSNRLGSLYAFLRYLIDHDLADAQLLTRKIKLKVPDALPRAMDAEDVKYLLAVLDDVRNRAMILLLLRTGMRIGELLNTKVVDVYLADKKIMVYEGEKNRKGRAVCFSNDASEALQHWLKQRDSQKQYLFYGRGGCRMSYKNARVLFKKYLTRAGLEHKDYSLHCLRHTFATELLNAGMHIECLQQLLGHSSIEMTLRYARLSDRTREQEYFKAMAIIEGEKIHEPDKRDHQLPPLAQSS